MRTGAWPWLLLVAACGTAQPPAEPAGNETEAAAPAESAASENKSEPEPTPSAEVPAQPPDDYAGVAELSPSQRRAYERGYRDCRAGRYEPGEWAEAYRIGCAAAQEGR